MKKGQEMMSMIAYWARVGLKVVSVCAYNGERRKVYLRVRNLNIKRDFKRKMIIELPVLVR